jgi:hypothetical protein
MILIFWGTSKLDSFCFCLYRWVLVLMASFFQICWVGNTLCLFRLICPYDNSCTQSNAMHSFMRGHFGKWRLTALARISCSLTEAMSVINGTEGAKFRSVKIQRTRYSYVCVPLRKHRQSLEASWWTSKCVIFVGTAHMYFCFRTLNL